MRILMVSMFSNHFFNWTEQLRDAGHEIYWIDVYDSNTYVAKIDFVHQIIGWRNKVNYPGRYWMKKNFPSLSNIINRINQRDLTKFFEEKIGEIKPDLVQSFVLQSATYPILGVMGKHPAIKWIYSAWGNDLYFRQQNEYDLKIIQKALPALDYMFADCDRDYELAKNLGLRGTYLGTFPTGGGYDFALYDQYIQSFENKNAIVIKGYQGNLGRCNTVLKAVKSLKSLLLDYEIVVFGANQEVEEFIFTHEFNLWSNFKFYKHIPHNKVLKLMGKSKIYIGNSISDGIPNTLLEAIIMGAFPIQSNPGGATAEIIEDNKNGFLIADPENETEMYSLILKAINNNQRLKEGVDYNTQYIKPKLERNFIKNQVIAKYDLIEQQLTSPNDNNS